MRRDVAASPGQPSPGAARGPLDGSRHPRPGPSSTDHRDRPPARACGARVLGQRMVAHGSGCTGRPGGDGARRRGAGVRRVVAARHLPHAPVLAPQHAPVLAPRGGACVARPVRSRHGMRARGPGRRVGPPGRAGRERCRCPRCPGRDGRGRREGRRRTGHGGEPVVRRGGHRPDDPDAERRPGPRRRRPRRRASRRPRRPDVGRRRLRQRGPRVGHARACRRRGQGHRDPRRDRATARDGPARDAAARRQRVAGRPAHGLRGTAHGCPCAAPGRRRGRHVAHRRRGSTQPSGPRVSRT